MQCGAQKVSFEGL